MKVNRESIDRTQIQIIRYSSEYHQQTIEILGLIWKTQDFQERDRLFQWRYLENPYLDEHFVFIAVYLGEVIGIAPYVIEKFSFGDTPKLVLAAADTVIKPEYQGVGVYARLANEAMDFISTIADRIQFGAYLNLSSNENSTPACTKLGWKHLAKRNNLYRISLQNYVMNRVSKTQRPKPNLKNTIAGLDFEITDEIRISELSKLAGNNKAPIRCIRDATYYQWRYSDQSGQYKFCYCYEGTNLVAYCVIQSINSLQSAIIEYAFSSQKGIIRLVRIAQKYLRIPIIRLYYMNLLEPEMLSLTKAGFIAEPKFFEHKLKKYRFPVLVRLRELNIVGKDAEIGGLDPYNPQNWSFAKSDVY